MKHFLLKFSLYLLYNLAQGLSSICVKQSNKTSCLATLFLLTLAICKTFISISPTMSSSDDKQTNPGETLPFTKIVQTIDNLIEHHPILKSKPSLEHQPIFESQPSLETTTATTSGNNSPKVEIKSEGKGSSKGGKEDSKIDSQPLEKIQNNLDQIKDSFIQLKKFEQNEFAKQLKTCLSDLDNLLEHEEKKTTGNTNAPSFSEINRKLMKLKYQIPSLCKMSWTSSRAQSRICLSYTRVKASKIAHFIKKLKIFLQALKKERSFFSGTEPGFKLWRA